MLPKPRVFIAFILFAGCLALSSCEPQKPVATAASPASLPQASAGKPVDGKPGKEARYECPMGCAGSQSTKPGKCPTCEMELEKKL